MSFNPQSSTFFFIISSGEIVYRNTDGKMRRQTFRQPSTKASEKAAELPHRQATGDSTLSDDAVPTSDSRGVSSAPAYSALDFVFWEAQRSTILHDSIIIFQS